MTGGLRWYLSFLCPLKYEYRCSNNREHTADCSLVVSKYWDKYPSVDMAHKGKTHSGTHLGLAEDTISLTIQ